MSMRLVTTPWLTKNFAGVALDTGGLLRCAGWGGAMPGLERRIVPHARYPTRVRPGTPGQHTRPGSVAGNADRPDSNGAGNHFRHARWSESGFRTRTNGGGT